MSAPVRSKSRFKHLALAAGVVFSAYGLGGTALASGDYGSPKVYSLVQGDLDNTVPFLAPTNDSRVTLMLLLADAGLAHAHTPAPMSPGAPPDPYAAQTPLDLDTLTSVYTDKTASGDASFVDGQGDRCRSNAAGGDGYLSALASSKVPKAEQATLSAARQAMASACPGDADATANPLPATAVKSGQGQEFLTYLNAASDFYAGNFTPARAGFAGLVNSSQPWLKEASRYMIARTDLNAAQGSAFGDYGDMSLDKVDAGTLGKADTEFRAYLHDYPKGGYAPSAQGLLRRVAWLAGDHTKLADAFGLAFAQSDPNRRNVSAVDLAYEADNKLLGVAQPGEIHEPRLLATLDLMQMRGDSTSPPLLTRAALEAQAPLFASQKALYDYLLAAYAFYDENNPAGALKILAATSVTPHMSNVQFSAQVLKGLALEATHSASAARAQWLALIPAAEPVLQRPAAELGLAQNYEHAGELAAVFAAGSPIRTPTYRGKLLTYSAGPDLLRQRAMAADATPREKYVAAATLLFKEVTRGRYQAYLDDLHLLPAKAPDPDPYQISEELPALGDLNWAGQTGGDDFPCPPLKTVATALAHNAHDERSLICLGEFLRANYDDGNLRNDDPPRTGTASPSAELATVASQFPGVGVSRLDIYKAIIADAKAAPDVRAYALYRAVYCWAPSGTNSCDGSDVPIGQRKAWFQQLKAKYPTSAWATSLKYYW